MASRAVVGAALVLGLVAGAAAQAPSLTGIFQTSPTGMLRDTNHDGLADTIVGHVVVPGQPSQAENAAAANFAARLTHLSMGLTPPLVVAATDARAAQGPHIYIGAGSVPAAQAGAVRGWTFRLPAGDGRVALLEPGTANPDILVVGDDRGLTAAADAFAARAPYQWTVGERADKLSDIVAAVNAVAPAAKVALVGLDYTAGKPGIAKAYLTAAGPVTAAELAKAFAGGHLAAVHELFVLGGQAITAVNPKPFAPKPEAPTGGAPAAAAAAGAGGGAGAAAPAAAGANALDLAHLYENHGLFNASGAVPVPAVLASHLYVSGGQAGLAMANLAARMGLEATGITLPVASPAGAANLKRINEQPVAAGETPVTAAMTEKLDAEQAAAGIEEAPLGASEGELQIVDGSFGSHAGLLVRGNDATAAAALDWAADRLPNLDRVGKQYVALEDIRYDLHQFFSQHSGVGQSAAGLFFLNRWLDEIGNAPVSNVHAELYADLVDPKMDGFLERTLSQRLHVTPTVVSASLRAGTQCCAANPDLHYSNPAYPFHPGKPIFTQDIHIPWEGTTLLHDVRAAARKLTPGQPVTLVARVSEGPAERQKLTAQLRDILAQAGAARGQTTVTVLDAYKQGYSWLTDEVAPALAALRAKGDKLASLNIEAAKDVDATGVRDMYSPARWMQELYPVDEVLAKQLAIPLAAIHLEQINTAPPVESAAAIALADPPNPPPNPTYRVRAYDAAGKLLLERDFTVTTAMRPYISVLPSYEQVQVDTGWVTLAAGGKTLLDQRIETDIEHFWDQYQTVTLPRVYRFIMAQAKGRLRPEFVPPFDTLQMDFHLSEPDYNIGVDKERISSIEALQEDVFYSTETFIDTLGDLKNGRPEDYVGRIIPVVHPSEDGTDGEVHIAFYGKAAPNPLVRLSWTDAQGQVHTRERDLPVLGGAFQPRLIAARVALGQPGVENLTWTLPADTENYDMEAWQKLEGREQLERSMFSVEQARGELHWLDAMHAAGLYRDELAYPGVHRMAVELVLPRPLGVAFTTPEQRVRVSWDVAPPAHPRPQIAAITPTPLPQSAQHRPGAPGPQADASVSGTRGEAALGPAPSFVQWDEPISPAESAANLARLAQYPGVNVYSMGRSYLGQVIWAADIMLPSPATLTSWAKQTTLKASIVYSARQHANEVSSTSHVERLAEMLVSDPDTRAYLKQVNVVLHPIDNPDGAQLSVIEAKIVPDNLLHLGYHGALAADVSSGQGQEDPVYPESRTRKQLLDQWLPDAFLNPHGYPSHEWVQPFSEYSGWVQSRNGANNGRTWWIPRGWFTSLNFARDDGRDTHSQAVTFALRDRIVDAISHVPGLMPLENRMNSRYQRWGQAFQPDNMQQPIVGGVRIYMSLKGSTGTRGGMAGPGASSAITWDQGYTEAPDETAHGDYMKLVASAGLAYDFVHLKYLAQGELRITRSERATPQGITWSVTRARPILPGSEPPAPSPDGH